MSFSFQASYWRNLFVGGVSLAVIVLASSPSVAVLLEEDPAKEGFDPWKAPVGMYVPDAISGSQGMQGIPPAPGERTLALLRPSGLNTGEEWNLSFPTLLSSQQNENPARDALAKWLLSMAKDSSFARKTRNAAADLLTTSLEEAGVPSGLQSLYKEAKEVSSNAYGSKSVEKASFSPSSGIYLQDGKLTEVHRLIIVNQFSFAPLLAQGTLPESYKRSLLDILLRIAATPDISPDLRDATFLRLFTGTALISTSMAAEYREKAQIILKSLSKSGFVAEEQ